MNDKSAERVNNTGLCKFMGKELRETSDSLLINIHSTVDDMAMMEFQVNKSKFYHYNYIGWKIYQHDRKMRVKHRKEEEDVFFDEVICKFRP